MLYIYKQSPKPLQAWTLLNVGGPNNLAPDVKAKYLVLHKADVMKLNGIWHCLFEFDTRDSLEKSGLAMLMSGGRAPQSYPDGADWRKFLGDEDWQVVDEHVRWEIMQLAEQAETVITDVRQIPSWHPAAKRLKMNPPLERALPPVAPSQALAAQAQA